MQEDFHKWLFDRRKSIEFLDVDLSKNQSEFLENIMFELEKNMVYYRELTDDFIISEALIQGRYDYRDKYPKGACFEITENVFKTALNNPKSVLSQIRDKGIVVKRVYGIMYDSFFQNGIEAGNRFVDLANDTWGEGGAKVKINLINDIDFKQIDSYEQMFEIMEKYWNAEIFPNHILPDIAPMFPYIIKLKGQIKFHSLHVANLLFSEVNTNFKMADNFLFNSKYSDKQMQSEDLDYFIKRLELTHFNDNNNLNLIYFSELNITDKNSFEKSYQNVKNRRNSFPDKQMFDNMIYNRAKSMIIDYNAGVKSSK